jgi:hypothetical protein
MNNDIYSKERQLTNESYMRVNTRRKNDGSLYRSRKDMKDNYDNTVLPYPLAVVKLDYCKNIIKAHVGNAFFFAMPMSFVFSYAFNPDIRTKGFKSRDYKFYTKFYLGVYSAMLAIFILDSLIFCDYCKPWSKLYSETSNSDYYKDMLKTRIKSEQRSNEVNYKRTRMSGLKDEEI